MERLIKVMDKYLGRVKLSWAQEELLQKLQDAAENHKELVILKTIAYEKDKDLDDSQRMLKVSKNRLFGKVNTAGWILNFDEKSKRIYGYGDDLNYSFGWDKKEAGFEQMEYCEETPFD